MALIIWRIVCLVLFYWSLQVLCGGKVERRKSRYKAKAFFGYNVLKHYYNKNMDTNTIPYDKEAADSEEGLLKQTLKPFHSQIADIKEGYNLLCLIVNAYRLDFPHIDLKLNNYYLQILQIIKPAFGLIETEIDSRYYQNKRHNLPSDFIHAQIFEGSFYEPFTSLHEAKQKISGKELNWATVETNMNECLGRINNAYFRIFGNDNILSVNQKFFTEVQDYVSTLTPTQEKNDKYICGGLTLDLTKGTLRYNSNNPVLVTIDGREMKFLRF